MTLWGDPDIDQNMLQRKPRRTPGSNGFIHMLGSCNVYGHAWEHFGITGLKKCSVCHVNGYCPGCTPVAPLPTAQPFYCTAHTPESEGL
jgi:hypothetical protein